MQKDINARKFLVLVKKSFQEYLPTYCDEIIFFFKPKRKLRPHFPFLQAMLREFEDQENLLAEMDEQVDAYRAAGKQEAALRYGQIL